MKGEMYNGQESLMASEGEEGMCVYHSHQYHAQSAGQEKRRCTQRKCLHDLSMTIILLTPLHIPSSKNKFDLSPTI